MRTGRDGKQSFWEPLIAGTARVMFRKHLIRVRNMPAAHFPVVCELTRAHGLLHTPASGAPGKEAAAVVCTGLTIDTARMQPNARK